MKCIIIYNTRSGNTELLGKEMCKILEKYNHECEIFRDKTVKQKILTQTNYFDPYDLICLGSPCHGSSPAFFPFRKILKNIAQRDLNGKKFIFFGTSGGAGGWKSMVKRIHKMMVNINHIGNIGCIKRKNEEALQNFDQIVKNLK